ncbi:hypothetical protein [Mucilaginibacter phyllosphaerae]
MDKHRGQIVEYLVRKKGINISELPDKLRVNRRTLYNWFAHPLLKPEVIIRIGIVIKHNFSIEFPELFLSAQFDVHHQPDISEELVDDNIWRTKYLELLEKYNETLRLTLNNKQKGELFILFITTFVMAA